MLRSIARGALSAVYQENARLTTGEREAAALAAGRAATWPSENAQLRSLLKLSPEPALSYVTARVVATSGGAYVRNIIG